MATLRPKSETSREGKGSGKGEVRVFARSIERSSKAGLESGAGQTTSSQGHTCHPHPSQDSSSISLEKLDLISSKARVTSRASCLLPLGQAGARPGHGHSTAALSALRWVQEKPRLPWLPGAPAAGQGVQPHVLLLDVLVAGLAERAKAGASWPASPQLRAEALGPKRVHPLPGLDHCVSNSALSHRLQEKGPSLSSCAQGRSLEHTQPWGSRAGMCYACFPPPSPFNEGWSRGSVRTPPTETHTSCEFEHIPRDGVWGQMGLPQRPGHSCLGQPLPSLTSRAVSRKSYRPPVWRGSIMSRIRWISAPRCWILEHHRRHRERRKRGPIRTERPAAGKEPWSGWLNT